ncbi:polysaccharide pyruvyl transferase family protein [Roseomonas sp. 18066]|uniref:polysaccharide pyruvyl transferase family protein n=1 Tax=Roseomonas sp. 18066 TaxID=2681412 RepID=UPI00135B1BF2|nr:polysaccharide pyruvyl transferase family protein [Roseomonas sp. 18066]
MTEPPLFFWRQEREIGNFGDALALVFLKRFFAGECHYPRHVLHLLGSVVTERRIEAVQAEARQALFWGCGKKDDQPLPAALRQRCTFLGIRGALSRDALGLPRDTPLGDPALLLPRCYRPQHDPVAAGKVLWVPHVHHDDPTAQDLEGCPPHLVRRADTPNTAEACESFIDAIASARFVMANAMHAAVVALAYGTPFAFWAGSGINVPFKWRDLTSAAGLELAFHRSFPEAARAFDRTRPDRAFAGLDLDPLLRVAPYARQPAAGA